MQNLTTDLNIIQALDDLPNAVGGLTADELKAKFDEGCNIIKDWINTVMIPALNSVASGSSGASEIGISPIVGLTGYTNVQDALAGVMNAFTQGTVLDGSVTTVKLANSAVTTAKIANSAVTSVKIANGNVTNEKVNLREGALAFGKVDAVNSMYGGMILQSPTNIYGTTLPSTPTAGRIFFKKIG